MTITITYLGKQPRFTQPTCMGDYVLGTACGRCEKCEWQRHQSWVSSDALMHKWASSDLLMHEVPANPDLPKAAPIFSLRRRIGHFSISIDLIDTDHTACLAILDGCIVVRAEMAYEINAISYTAMHAHFDEVPDGIMAPTYDGQIIRDPDGSVSRKWRLPR